jgi:arginine exporter protein ArgO
MDIWQGLIIITAVHLLAAASPGPDFVLVSQQSLVHGKKAGILCSIGIALGLSVHIVYSAFGLAAIIASSSTALWAIKLLGGGYLIYLGIKGLRARASATEGAPQEKCRALCMEDGWPRLSLQCTQPKSAFVLCCAVHRCTLGCHARTTHRDLRCLDDAYSVGVVLPRHLYFIKPESNPKISAPRSSH